MTSLADRFVTWRNKVRIEFITSSMTIAHLFNQRWAALIHCFVTSGVCAFSWSNALAGTFHVSPLRVDVGGISRSGVITIRNDSPTDSVVIQTRSFKWSQLDG